MKRFLLLFLVVINLSVLPSFADDQIAEITADSTSSDVLVDLPQDLEPGYHQVDVEVIDPDTGEASIETIDFCKDKTGEISWENICPELDIVVDPATLETIENVEDLPTYNPESEPEKVAQTQVAGFTALSVLSAGGAAVGAAVGGSAGGGSSGGAGGGSSGGGSAARVAVRREEGSESSDAELVDDALHSSQSKRFAHDATYSDDESSWGPGDRSRTWRAPFTPVIDAAVVATSLKASRFAPLLGKFLIDASYLRAIFGSLSLLTIPLGLIIGVQALLDSNFQAMPPRWTLFAAIAVLSVFDAVGGAVAGLVYVLGIFIFGEVSGLNGILTVLAVFAIAVSPPILAGSFRPFRRKITPDEGPWERATDYLLAGVLTKWTITGFIGALNVIAGKQLAISGNGDEIGITVGIAVLLRMISEDCATYFYPNRTAKFVVDQPKPSKRQQYISMTLKAVVFALVMQSFVGLNAALLVGTVLFIFPSVAKLAFGGSLPKSRMLHMSLPRGGVRIVAMTIMGTLFAKLSADIFKDPQDFLTWGFVLLSIPGFAISVLSMLSDDKDPGKLRSHPFGKWIYRVGGVIIFFLIVLITLGTDIVAFIL
jgi:hypothetical protein